MSSVITEVFLLQLIVVGILWYPVAVTEAFKRRDPSEFLGLGNAET